MKFILSSVGSATHPRTILATGWPDRVLLLGTVLLLLASLVTADDDLVMLRTQLQQLQTRIEALEQANQALHQQLTVDRLLVKQELIISDTGQPWEQGFETQEIPRGFYARSQWDGGSAGLWVRSRLIKGELDDPFDDRFHALNRDGTLTGVPGHISWNVWLDGTWRQMVLIEGGGVDYSELPLAQWSGASHPGRLRFLSFRPDHDEPLTDALIGQGMMSLGGGGYGGEGLPYPKQVLQLWGGSLTQFPVATPSKPSTLSDDGSGPHTYSIIAVGPQGERSAPSPATQADGLATLRWGDAAGADCYVVLRDGEEVSGFLYLEGKTKEWTDQGSH